MKVKVKKKNIKDSYQNKMLESHQEKEDYECTNEDNTSKLTLKKWLECNKIYFDTLMTVTLTVMGICISSVSCQYEKSSVKIQEAQSLASEQLNMPIFNVSQNYYDEYTEDGITHPAGLEVNIVNNGGNITEGYLDAEFKIEMVVLDEHYDQIAVIALEDTSKYAKSFSYYDAQSKSFIIKIKSDMRDFELRYFLDEKLSSDYSDYHISILMYNYVHIQYKDFTDEFHSEWYALGDGDLLDRTPLDADTYKAMYFDSMTNMDIYNQIREMLDELLIEDISSKEQ